jgi:hypothetical protein
MTTDRRPFDLSLVLAIYDAAPPTVAPEMRPSSLHYSHRLIFTGMDSPLSFWARVINLSNVTSDVTFTVQLASDPNCQRVVQTVPMVARAMASHIVRASIYLEADEWTQGAPLYSRLSIEHGRVLSRVRCCHGC